ncbi:hypothetical protein AB9P05_05660 [Roseivirga sp. BDSF3-8]|uniref:hypothetical protein n=1 Tax=Roseivirga sp. BDSF3-8 TaxID=3241598 RepID=UPI003531A5D5
MKSTRQMTGEESLQLISRMINTAKGNVKGSSFHLLLWGWVVMLANLGHFYLMEFTSYPHPYIVWLITIPAWIVSFIYGYRQSSRATVRTYTDDIVLWTWVAMSFSLIVLIFSGQLGNLITPVVLLFAGMATFISGLLLRFRPLIYGGSSFWLFSAVAFQVSPSYALLVSAIAIACGYLIPGYMLKSA